MKIHQGLFGLCISSWVNLNLSQVSAIKTLSTTQNVRSARGASLNPPTVDTLVLNVTSPGAIDPAFGFVQVLGDIKLRPVPCLLNSVNAALQLALGDFEGFISEKVFRLDSHPQVEIAVVPDDEGGSIPQKYAVWGLSIGIDMMIRNRDFQTAVFVLTYQGHGVACITYKVPTASDSAAPDITNATQRVDERPPLLNTTKAPLQASTGAKPTSINTVDATTDPHLRVAFQLTGSVITIYNIFNMAIDLLRDLAAHGRVAHFADFTAYLDAANLVISTRQNRPPRTALDPPYFQTEWLMRAVAQTPAYMLEQGSFREVDMVLYVDEVKVGEVSIRRPRSGSGLVRASDGVSTS